MVGNCDNEMSNRPVLYTWDSHRIIQNCLFVFSGYMGNITCSLARISHHNEDEYSDRKIEGPTRSIRVVISPWGNYSFSSFTNEPSCHENYVPPLSYIALMSHFGDDCPSRQLPGKLFSVVNGIS